MEVDKTSFYPLLLDILTDISESHFVAIDLELSGVPSKGIRTTPGKQTLAERYLETKAAAERYQILQIGVTCVTQDVEHGKYVLRPYNFDLNPLIEERNLDIERIFSYQSGAVEFLLNVGFDLARPFHTGVPYLSRHEAKEAREKQTKRADKSSLADINIKPTDLETLAFLARVREEIAAWLAKQDPETPEYLDIAPLELTEQEVIAGKTAANVGELSRFEKRLVHQLVRAEYPTLITISKRGYIQVKALDQEREDRFAAERRRSSREAINRQKGFRWIIDALLGRDISQLDLRECARNSVTGEQIFVDMDDMSARFHRASSLMRYNPRILVGHNCFLDLVYIYRTFIGALPETVEGFQAALHECWPVIVDTKYMSTHECGDINPVSSLEQIAEQMSRQLTPTLEVEEHHGKYTDVEAFHEAGFDSFLTAQIMVKLSAKLEREGMYKTNVEDAALQKKTKALALTDEAPTNGHVYSDENNFVPSDPNADWKHGGDPSVGPPVPQNRVIKYDNTAQMEAVIEGGMPKMGGAFWRVYGNKLRVFGTEEGVCVLAPVEQEVEVEAEVEVEEDEDGEGGGGVGLLAVKAPRPVV